MSKNSNPQVERWFRELEHPLKGEMQLVRAIILAADDRMTESIKWSTPTFEYKGNLASFQSNAKRLVSLMFHRGSEIPGTHPELDGEGALVRTMRFANEAEIETRRDALVRVVRAWCDWRAG